MTLKDRGDSVPSAQAGARERVLRGGRATKHRRASLKSPWRNVNLDRQSMRGQNTSWVDLKASDSENSPGSQKIEKKRPENINCKCSQGDGGSPSAAGESVLITEAEIPPPEYTSSGALDAISAAALLGAEKAKSHLS